MNILILPNSQKPFDIDKSDGGLVSDARLERAKSMYERYNKAEYIKQWKIILGAL